MPSWSKLALSLALAIISGGLSSIDPLLMRTLLDRALPQQRLGVVLGLIIAICGSLLVRALFLLWSIQINYVIEQNLCRSLRMSILGRLVQLSADYHERIPAGEKLSLVERDVEQIAALASEITSKSVYALVFFAANLAMMVHINPAIALTMLPILTAFWWVRRRFAPLLKERADASQTQAGQTTGVLCEYVSGLPQIQLLTAENVILARVYALWTQLVETRKKQSSIECSYTTDVNSVVVVAILIVLTVGSLGVLRGAVTIGGLVALYAYSTRLFEPASSIMDVYSRSQRMGASIRRVRAVLEQRSPVADLGKISEPIEQITQGIALTNVSFRYTLTRWALQNISFEIRHSKHLAIVGPSGSGKSTLARLLVRLSDPENGEIRLDGYPLRDYALSALRRTICYVPQGPVLFDGSLLDNLLYGNPRASSAELKDVLSVAQLDTVVGRLPHGIQTRIGPSGYALSGGERQRLAVARALLMKAPVLVLDESTSALDVATEEAVLRGIMDRRAPSILIIISHRLASLRWMPLFLVLEHGKIHSVGGHERLYSECPVYKRLYESNLRELVN